MDWPYLEDRVQDLDLDKGSRSFTHTLFANRLPGPGLGPEAWAMKEEHHRGSGNLRPHVRSFIPKSLAFISIASWRHLWTDKTGNSDMQEESNIVDRINLPIPCNHSMSSCPTLRKTALWQHIWTRAGSLDRRVLPGAD